MSFVAIMWFFLRVLIDWWSQEVRAENKLISFLRLLHCMHVYFPNMFYLLPFTLNMMYLFLLTGWLLKLWECVKVKGLVFVVTVKQSRQSELQKCLQKW